MKKKNPVIGETCPALTNENYQYHLSGDLYEFCICSITGRSCIGKTIGDRDGQSSQFFSRAKCDIDYNEIKTCPLYGVSNETFKSALKDRTDKEYNEKIGQIK